MAEQRITPWDVEVVSTDEVPVAIDYDKIINQFGCEKFNQALADRLEKLSGKPAHYFFRRGIVFAHRDFNLLLDEIANNRPFYLYTGRGPSSKTMHIGHTIPFLLCKYMQDAFKIRLVIQITDDEKFLWKSMRLEDAMAYGRENIKDIVALGFDPKLTYIFSNVEASHHFEENILKISKTINLNEAIKVFGFDMSSNIGQVGFPAKEIAPCFSSSFRFIGKGAMCLVPAAVDQDPFFRLARDKAKALGEKKPSSIYVSLLPDLKGVNRKMSASDPNSSIYLDDAQDTIRKKIIAYAYSGGRKTLEEHREKGGDIDVDVPFEYLKYFLDDDQELEKYRSGYIKGEITSKEMKEKCVVVIQEFVSRYQESRKRVTDDDLRAFIDINKF
ncbi:TRYPTOPHANYL tRNA SYNTHETASE [Encephalitozoon cuniculi GB-M1]|uniref:Tryptophan--tRNA ligase n=2 Tax=Encephalitozoon cuniculi TaxID=6035 RepID=SYW_ENCCU|nr:tryptophan--tRNA ligase WRS1 [Encephalitozoon cuniculi GB-M1]O96771.2 RecName: Full=Tryptophan--tRNA ligase; AltName: Full=Tryptophanyl-tRNA synthetase; Short=TrpRS [Encephalitozoon cuniculi GB-M1]AGE94899.1 tryptophanyl tRNA synthetase [Encephalitozoon cuniculi]KMV65010.1 aminoacyl-tRNA ligase [Encephalitozoon cuniculi EcunIII-L]UYI26253.1 tryptohan-tRNA ligase [Encephalitozoon cuniculi]CAD25963.1 TRYPTOPHANYL tRNA SYNTHETASE [Encephalitozoon cuniculi GB-M1]